MVMTRAVASVICYSDALDGSEELNLTSALTLSKGREFSLQAVKPPIEELDYVIHGLDGAFVRNREAFKRASEVAQGVNLLVELPDDSPLLPEFEYGVALHSEGPRIHLLPVQGDESGIDSVSLDGRKYGPGKVLYLLGILHADSDTRRVEQVEQQCDVIAGSLHYAVDTAVLGKSSDELPYIGG